eukprot:COSAG02_NODE_10432_length_1941_cov_10.276330_1_plen_49_part_00
MELAPVQGRLMARAGAGGALGGSATRTAKQDGHSVFNDTLTSLSAAPP